MTLRTKNNDLYFSVDTNVKPIHDNDDYDKFYEKGGVTFVLYDSTSETKYGTLTNVNNCAYIIEAKRYEDLIYILDHLVIP